MLYFAQIGDDAPNGPVKIGYTANAQKRLMTLQSGHYLDYRFIRVVKGAPADELRVHRLFQHLRIRGEWFRFDPAMLSDLGLDDLPLPVAKTPRLRGQWLSDSTRAAMSRAMKLSWQPGGLSRTRYLIRKTAADLVPLIREPPEPVEAA